MRSRERLLDLLAFAAAVVGVLLALALLPRFLNLAATNPLSDVRAYYDAATRLNSGRPLYDLSIDLNASEFYRYPPLLAIAFRPLALLPYETAAAIWEGLMVASFLLTLRILGLRRRVLYLLGILAYPIIWALLLGQAQVAVTLLLTIASPWSVALAGQLKLLPALAALYWVGRRDWWTFAKFGTVSVALVALQLFLEPAGTVAFLGIANLAQVGDIVNLSPYAVSPLLWALLALGGAMVALRFAPSPWGWTISVTYSVLVSPRLMFYLLVALLGGASTRGGRGERTLGYRAGGGKREQAASSRRIN